MLIRSEPETLARRDLERAAEYAKRSRADSTAKAYRTDWSDFLNWCESRGAEALPAAPTAVAAYIAHLAESKKPSTIRRRLASISVAHKTAGHQSPTGSEIVCSVMAGIERTIGAPQKRVSPVRARNIRKAVLEMNELSLVPGRNAKVARDAALVLLGYAGAFRRSELVSLRASDLIQDEGVLVTLRRSKTDQKGEGHAKAVGYGAHLETCPVRSLKVWMQMAGLAGEDPLFPPIKKGGLILKGKAVSDRAVALILKGLADAMGLEPSNVSGHSLRAGFATDGYAVGLPEAVIAEQTGHKSRQVLGIYRREADRFAVNCSSSVGL